MRGLGAVTAVLPREGDVPAGVHERFPDGVDALLDLVNYEPGSLDAALKAGGRVASPTGAAGEGPGRTNIIAQPASETLGRVARLLETGTLKVPVQATYELEQAAEGLKALGATHTQGKLAISVA